MDKGVIIFQLIFLNWNGRNTGKVRGRLKPTHCVARSSVGKCGSTLSACVITVGEESEDLTFQISLHFRTEVWFGNQVDDKLVGGLGEVQVGSRGAFPPRVGDVAATTNPRDWCNTRASGGRLSEQLWSLGSGQACQQRLCVAAVFQQGSYGSILMKLRCQSNG